MDYIDLESVGSTVQSDGLVFPIDISEPPVTASDADDMMGVSIFEVCDEWVENLSSDDLKSFFNFIVEVNGDNMVMSIFNQWKTQIWGSWEEMNNCYMNLEVA